MASISLDRPQFEFLSADGSTGLAFEDVALDENLRRFRTVWRLPIEVDEFHAHMALSQAFSAEVNDPTQQEAVWTTGLRARPRDYRGAAEASSRHPFLRHLGYGSQYGLEENGDSKTIVDELTYPTADALNRFMDVVFGDDGSARFEVYDGDEYEAVEFVEALGNRGRILVADKAPFSAHDLFDHAIGWLGVDAAYAQALIAGSAACIKHARNSELKRELGSKGLFADIAGGLDIFSGSVASDVVLSNSDIDRESELRRSYSSGMSVFTDMINGLIAAGQPYAQFDHFGAHDLAKSTVGRYARANSLVEE